MAKNYVPLLRSIGLSEREAELYLIGLELGSAPASQYAERSTLNRVTAYNTLEALVQKGIFTKEKRKTGKWYAPVPPEYLITEARKNVTAIERILPELSALQGSSHRKPTVRFFEGAEGLKHVYDDTLTAGTDILNFANSAVVRAYWPTYDLDYVAERVGQKIYLRGIAPDDKAGREVQGHNKENFREIRLVRAKEFDFTNEINIYDNKVAICSFGSDPFGVIIESKEVAETQRQIFEMAWRYAGKK